MISVPTDVHLLDTSAVILLMRHRLNASSEALIPFATLGELMTGVFSVSNPAQELARIRRTVASATTIFPTNQTVYQYGRITAHLRRTGLPIPTNDVWNAALAIEHSVPLLSDDMHFGRVPGLQFIAMR